MRARGWRTALPLVLLAGALAGCASQEGSATSAEGTSGGVPEPTAATSPVSPEPSGPSRFEAGTVREGEPVQVSGSGQATVSLEREGDFGMVLSIDCDTCTGTVSVAGVGESQPFLEGTGPYRAEALFAVGPSSTDRQTLTVVADGQWELAVLSWRDIQPTYGEISATGSAVMLVGDDASEVEVWCQPEAGQACTFTAYSDAQSLDQAEPRSASEREEFTAVLEVAMPGVVTVNTDGPWRMTPRR